MASVHDVARYILECQGGMTAWKLQKLVYYSQAWHLVWDDEPIFEDRIEAWANGPVVPALYRKHRGQFTIGKWKDGDTSNLSEGERSSIDVVLKSYGDLTGQQLSRLTHSEGPWREARGELAPTERSQNQISLASMQAFYLSLDASDDARPVGEIDWDALPAS